MRTPRSPGDLTDAQWARIEPLIPLAKAGGRPREVDMRALLDGILYQNRRGCQWRMLPGDFPPWRTVYYYYRQWRLDGVSSRIHDTLRAQIRQQPGKEPTPSAAVIDSQSVKGVENGELAAAMTPARSSPGASGTLSSTRLD